MKVADGFWLSKKGYEVNYASQAYKVETTENAIKVLATPYTLYSYEQRNDSWRPKLRDYIFFYL